jgi:thioesterase domain-containing protein
MSDNLVPLRTGGGRTTVFIHPASGLITAFRRVVPHLPGNRNAVAFENPEPRPDASCSIDALAADYWHQLSAHSNGPILLAGWSFGGIVALAMASLAEAAGRPVTCVALIDSGPPQLLRERAAGLPDDLAGLFEIKPAELPPVPLPTAQEQVLDIIADVLRRTRGIPGITAADLQPFVDTFHWHVRAMRRPWRFAGCAAPVVLIRARDERGWRDAPEDLGWSHVLGDPPRLLWTPGTHHDLMSAEHAPHLAALLSTRLASPDRAVSLARGACA